MGQRIALLIVILSSIGLGAFGYHAYGHFFPAEPAIAAPASHNTFAQHITLDSIHRLYSSGDGEDCYRSGTGWAIANDENGTFLITNAHVVIGAQRIDVADTIYQAKVVRLNVNRDLALVYVANLLIPPLKTSLNVLANNENTELTSWGFPGGAKAIQSHSYNGVYLTNENYLTNIYSSYRGAPAIAGESGSPIFNNQNQVVGTVYASGDTGASFTPVSDAISVLNDWNENPVPIKDTHSCAVIDEMRAGR